MELNDLIKDGLVCETTLKEISVTIDGKNYILRELDGIQKGKYLNKMGSRVKLGPSGRVESLKDYSGLETTLLTVCLYDEEGQLVPAPTMEKWPSTVLSKLFDAAQLLSGLNEEARKKLEDDAKNS